MIIYTPIPLQSARIAVNGAPSRNSSAFCVELITERKNIHIKKGLSGYVSWKYLCDKTRRPGEKKKIIIKKKIPKVIITTGKNAPATGTDFD